MRFLPLDAETFYCSKTGYTLSKMTAEEYIRDPRFELIGFSYGPLGTRPVWYTGTIEYLRSVAHAIDWSQVFAVGHNLSMFDSLILTEVLGVRPAAYGCTLQLARCMHDSKTPDGKSISNILGALAKMYQREIEQILGRPLFNGNEVVKADGKRRLDFTPQELADYGVYCCDDTELAGALWQVLSTKVPKSELFLASTVTKMWAQPRLVLDGPLLAAMKIEIAELLQSYDVDVPMKRSPKKRDAEGKAMLVYAFAKTDEGMTNLAEYEDGEDEETNLAVQAIANARLGTKSTQAEGRVQRLHGISTRGPLTVPLEYGKTLTDRLACGGKINLQNLNQIKPIK